jgi:NAD+ diphosphatase
MGLLHGWRTCPRCASALESDGARAACARCGSVFYAHSAPCACALVEDADGRVLLARRAVEPDRGKWDLPGGFLEEGEAPVDGLRRELLEETGLEGEPGRFVGAWMDTYGDGPDAVATLNLYYEVHVGGAQPAAADDVAELAWFDRNELPHRDQLAFTSVADALVAWYAARTAGAN